MPIFEYQCPKCQSIRELVQLHPRPRPEIPLHVECFNCHYKHCEKIISLTGKPRFKGAGFYENDYKGK